jgi:hypothetical protein
VQYTLDLCQRWNGGRSSYRKPDETIRVAQYDVATISDDSTARSFILEHHYAGTYPAARHRIGLYRRGELVGVAVFSHPCSDAVLTNVFPAPAQLSVELGRFVLLDSVPANGESWFIRRAFDILRNQGIIGVVSFSDPLARMTADGKIIHRGHVGIIYQACNAHYAGRVCRPLRHRGCHKYAWPLSKAARRMLPRSLPYPKSLD